MARRLLLLTLLLTAQVGCPHAWGRGGTIEEALARDINEYYSMRNCSLDEEAWENSCLGFHQKKDDPEAQKDCPPECRPPRP
jgi:hypothetical protein